MIKFINLENYRNISTKRNFDLRKITVLIGPNNFGKSSLIKSLLLMVENRKDFQNLILQNGKHKLGNFNTIKSKTYVNNSVEFELPFYLAGSNTIKLRYEGRDNSINNGRLIELCIYNSTDKDKCEYLKVEGATYGIDTNRLHGFVWRIDYCKFFEKIISDTTNEYNSKINHSESLKKMGWGILTEDLPTFEFNPTLPIFDFEYRSETKNIATSENKNFEYSKAILEIISNKGVEQIDEEHTKETILAQIKSVILQDYMGETSRLTILFDEFKNRFGITKIKATLNGKAFFDKVVLKIDEAFLLLSSELANLNYLPSSAASQERLFIDNAASHFQISLSKYLEAPKWENKDFLNIWMRKFKLISDTEEVQINRPGQAGFEIILKNNETNDEFNLSDCGFGVTQIFTLLSEFSYSQSGTQYLVEEPEVNLHPDLQSKLADLFCTLIKKNSFIIETHSEYMVRKFQYLVAKGDLKPSDIIIHYFWKDDGVSKSKPIEIRSDGMLSESFEPGFYDEADKIALDLFLLKTHQNN